MHILKHVPRKKLDNTDWVFFQFDRTDNPASYADFPKIGYDDTAYYLTYVRFLFGTTNSIFSEERAFGITKKSLFSGNPQVIELIHDTKGVLAPLQIYDKTCSKMYFVQATSPISLTVPSSTIQIWSVENISFNPIVKNISINVPPFLEPNLISQPDSSYTINPDDSRFYVGVMRNNHIWTITLYFCSWHYRFSNSRKIKKSSTMV